VAVALAVTVALAACTARYGPDPHRTPDPTGLHPPRFDASRVATRWPIKHVVFLIKENRSFDNLFGRLPGANGASVGFDHGVERPLTPAVDELPIDLRHDHETSVSSVNGGGMDGFDVSAIANRFAYTSFLPQDIPNYWFWATHYVVSDDFFSSVDGPSFPNHLFTIAATSGGTVDNPEQSRDRVQLISRSGYSRSWGCDIGSDGFVVVQDAEGEEEKISPCFDFLTEGDLLSRAGIPWAYYSATNTQNGYIFSAYAAVRRYRENHGLWDQHMFPVDNVIDDIHADRLPPVTWITPVHELSDHPEHSMCQGENWTTQVVNAIMRSPMWEDTAIFVTWDEWGGFYDHVPPRRIDPFGFGIRVPLLVISPYAKRGWIDHVEGEFSSVLRFIEDDFGLTQLTDRDRLAHDLSYDFDFSQRPRPPTPLPLRTCANPIDPSPIRG